MYISDADLLIYDPLGACTAGSFIHRPKLYGKIGLQAIGHNQSIWGIQNYSFSESMCQYKQFEVCFIKIGAILDFDSLYKFEMTFDL